MDPLVFAAAMASAVLHAAWNATVKNARDTDGAMAATIVLSGVGGLPLLAFFPLPAAESWPWIAVSVVTANGALRFMTMAYERGAFALAYPIGRGASPLLVVAIGALVLGDVPGAATLLGVTMVSLGIGLLALQARVGGSIAVAGLASASAICLALVTIADSSGVRVSGSLVGYGCVVSALNGLTFAIRPGGRGVSILAALRRNFVPGLIAGTLATGSYFAVLWAYEHGPRAQVAALRETSVVFATLLASYWLRERVGWVRWSAVALVAAGAVALRLA